MKLSVTLCLSLFTIGSLFSQNFNWWSRADYDQAMISEMHSPLSKVELVGINRLHSEYYKANSESRLFNEIQSGFQLPIFEYSKNMAGGMLKIAGSFPVSALLFIDMYEPETAPVINNDYRFGGKITGLYYPNAWQAGFVKSVNLTLVPLFHESTHLGDEYSLHGYQTLPDFKRINISYEAWQIFVGFNRPDGSHSGAFSAELGYQLLMPYKESFYAVDSLEVKGADITLSERRDLWIMRINYQNQIKRLSKSDAQFVFSSEIRLQNKLGYTSDNPEKEKISANTYAGMRFPIKNSRRRLGVFFRYYYGIVPYGQLRDEAGFRLTGLSLVMD